eukprot:SAG11_NODE_53006_length_104_cov_1593.600000_1_plen_24_part_10
MVLNRGEFHIVLLSPVLVARGPWP